MAKPNKYPSTPKGAEVAGMSDGSTDFNERAVKASSGRTTNVSKQVGTYSEPDDMPSKKLAKSGGSL